MFSREERCIYRKNQLEEVICQLRYPEILSIGANAPVDFQEAIREQYPVYLARPAEAMPKWLGGPSGPQPEASKAMSYSFATPDGGWRIDLNSRFLSLSCRSYTRWEEFARRLDRPLAEFIRIYKPAYFERIGLRYLNFFSRKNLDLEGEPFRELIDPCYLGVLADTEIREFDVPRNMVEAEFAIRGGCLAHIHSGIGRIRRGAEMDPELKFIFDQDLYLPGRTPVNHSAGVLETMHGAAWSVFRGAVTSRLHEAMEPEEI